MRILGCHWSAIVVGIFFFAALVIRYGLFAALSGCETGPTQGFFLFKSLVASVACSRVGLGFYHLNIAVLTDKLISGVLFLFLFCEHVVPGHVARSLSQILTAAVENASCHHKLSS